MLRKRRPDFSASNQEHLAWAMHDLYLDIYSGRHRYRNIINPNTREAVLGLAHSVNPGDPIFEGVLKNGLFAGILIQRRISANANAALGNEMAFEEYLTSLATQKNQDEDFRAWAFGISFINPMYSVATALRKNSELPPLHYSVEDRALYVGCVALAVVGSGPNGVDHILEASSELLTREINMWFPGQDQ